MTPEDESLRGAISYTLCADGPRKHCTPTDQANRHKQVVSGKQWSGQP